MAHGYEMPRCDECMARAPYPLPDGWLDTEQNFLCPLCWAELQREKDGDPYAGPFPHYAQQGENSDDR